MIHSLDHVCSWGDGAPQRIPEHVRELQGQLVDFDTAIKAQRELIDFDGNIFPYQLSLQHLEAERHIIKEELASLMHWRRTESLGIALDGADFDKHCAPIAVLADFLKPFQATYKRVYQATVHGISRKLVPPGITQASQLRMAGLYDSSFGMIITTPSAVDQVGDSKAIWALERTMAMFQDESIGEETISLGGWALSSYRKVIESLSLAGATPKIEWRNPSGENPSWAPDYATIRAIENRLIGIKEVRTELGSAEGVLIDAHGEKLSFELKKGRGSIKGHFPIDMMNVIEPFIWKACRIDFEESVILDAGEGRERRVITLHNITHIN